MPLYCHYICSKFWQNVIATGMKLLSYWPKKHKTKKCDEHYKSDM